MDLSQTPASYSISSYIPLNGGCYTWKTNKSNSEVQIIPIELLRNRISIPLIQLGFGLTEVIALFALMMAFLIFFVF